MAGKGSHRRPSFISDEEYSLRWDLAHGRITSAEFENGLKKLRRKEATSKKGKK